MTKRLAALALTLVLASASPALARLALEPIREVIRAHLPQIRRCYEDRLQGHPDLAGRVTVRFTIVADGSVSDASVTDTTVHDAPMEECILARVREMHFAPVPTGGSVAVNYPFIFQRSE